MYRVHIICKNIQDIKSIVGKKALFLASILLIIYKNTNLHKHPRSNHTSKSGNYFDFCVNLFRLLAISPFLTRITASEERLSCGEYESSVSQDRRNQYDIHM